MTTGSIAEQLRSTASALRAERWRPLVWCPLLIGTTIAIAFATNAQTSGRTPFFSATIGFVAGAITGLVIQVLVIVLPIVLSPFLRGTLRIALWALVVLAIGAAFVWLASHSAFWILVGAIVVGGFLLALVLAAVFGRRSRGRAA